MGRKAGRAAKDAEIKAKEGSDGSRGRRFSARAVLRLVLSAALFMVGGCTLISEASVAVSYPERRERLSRAVFVTDGRVRPENEGKLVAVVIDMEGCGNAADAETGIRFGVPLVRKVFEDYTLVRKKRTVSGKKKNNTKYYDEWEWGESGSEILWGGRPGLEFDIPAEAFGGLPAGSRIPYPELDESASVLTRADGGNGRFSLSPKRRVLYKDMGISAATAVGIQRGNRLEKEPEIESMYEGVGTAEELVSRDLSDNLPIQIVFGVLFGALPLLLATLFLRRGIAGLRGG